MNATTAIKNRTVFTRDNLEVMRGMEDACMDLIYLDPPFNSKKEWNAPIGSKAAGAAFKDTWTLSDLDEAWLGEIARERPDLEAFIDAVGKINGDSDKSYLIMMAMRLLEMHRILKDSGSIYLHCDPVMSHALKLLMDSIFGKKNFRNEVVWHYASPGGRAKKYFSKKHDVLLFYTKSDEYFFDDTSDDLREDISDISLQMHYKQRDEDGRLYRERTVNGKKYRYYADERKAVDTVWNDIRRSGSNSPLFEENVGYPTQKPLALLERIIKASSPEDGWVFDPFCGCATTCVAADNLYRNWIGIDISKKAVELVRERFTNHHGLFQHVNKIIHRTDAPLLPGVAKYKKADLKTTLYGRQQGNCKGCGEHFGYRHLEIDHIVPLAKGGQDTSQNCQLLCGHCNRLKGDKDMAWLLAKLKELNIL